MTPFPPFVLRSTLTLGVLISLCLGEVGLAAAGPPTAEPWTIEDRDFRLELLIHDQPTGARMTIRAWRAGQPLPAESVQLRVELKRLEGRTDVLQFAPQGELLQSLQTIAEPHSFLITVQAANGEEQFSGQFEHFEGRVTIPAATAQAAGVATTTAGPALIHQTRRLPGRIQPHPGGEVRVHARYPGTVEEVHIDVGVDVRPGQPLARIRSLDSLQLYTLTAPLSGRLRQHGARVGELAGPDTPLFVITDLQNLQVELAVLPSELPQIRSGQTAIIRDLDGQRRRESVLQALLPGTQPGGVHHAYLPLPNPGGDWHVNEFVEVEVDILRQRVPLAVERSALQDWWNQPVVFVRVADTYEARRLTLGRQDDRWAEVLDGLEQGTVYVNQNSYLIKADIEKSGAAHVH